MEHYLRQYSKRFSLFIHSAIILCIWCDNSMVYGQNLLTDGGFEVLNTNECFEPDEGFRFTSHWYALDATPDLVVDNCPLDEDGLIFWDAAVQASEGNNYVGLASRFNSNESYISEGIASVLETPLEEEGLYQISLSIRPKGYYQGFPDDLIDCPLRPKKHLDIYLSTDTILIKNDTANGTANATGHLVARITDTALEQLEPGDWVEISDCFQASGGESHFGITQPLDDFGVLPACIAETNGGTFHTHYYDLDDVQLTRIPAEFSATVELCRIKGSVIDLNNIFTQSFFKSATFKWNNGLTGARQKLKTPGDYEIIAQLPCGDIKLLLTAQSINCQPQLYLPNAFSPNDDKINDTFAPLTNPNLEIQNYQLRVYNRWGGLVYTSQKFSDAWDGQIKDTPAPEGLYIWVVQCEINLSEEWFPYSSTGEIVLIK